MKKLSLEAMFHPELPGPENKHKFSRQPRNFGGSGFPYSVDGEDETMTDKEVDEELGLMEFKLGRTMNSRDNLSIGKVRDSQSFGGKGSKSYANYMTNNVNNEEDKEFTGAMKIGVMNPDDEVEMMDLSLVEMVRSARNRATKEMGPVSTKQPWANGMPSDQTNPYLITDTGEEEENLGELEREVGLSLEAVMQGCIPREKEDLDFFEKLDSKNDYLMNTEDEFKESQRKKVPHGPEKK